MSMARIAATTAAILVTSSWSCATGEFRSVALVLRPESSAAYEPITRVTLSADGAAPSTGPAIELDGGEYTLDLSAAGAPDDEAARRAGTARIVVRPAFRYLRGSDFADPRRSAPAMHTPLDVCYLVHPAVPADEAYAGLGDHGTDLRSLLDSMTMNVIDANFQRAVKLYDPRDVENVVEALRSRLRLQNEREVEWLLSPHVLVVADFRAPDVLSHGLLSLRLFDLRPSDVAAARKTYALRPLVAEAHAAVPATTGLSDTLDELRRAFTEVVLELRESERFVEYVTSVRSGMEPLALHAAMDIPLGQEASVFFEAALHRGGDALVPELVRTREEPATEFIVAVEAESLMPGGASLTSVGGSSDDPEPLDEPESPRDTSDERPAPSLEDPADPFDSMPLEVLPVEGAEG